MRVVVGLGNPAPDYAATRHNVGDQAMVTWCQAHHVAAPSRKHGGLLTIDDLAVTLFRPSVAAPATYMNVLGPTVAQHLQQLQVAPADLLVICDDLNLPLGQLRLRHEGSAGGHHGLESVMAALGTTAFPRLRIGIGAVPPGLEGAAFVLSHFTAEERPMIETACATAAQTIDVWLHQGTAAAMNQFNRRMNPEDVG